MQMREVYAECLGKLMEQDPKTVLLDADLGKASGTLGLRRRFPLQIFDCGVAEQNMASIAAGMASCGYRPWIETFAPFATRRICDQIAISICYAQQNVKVVGTDPGIAAELNGATHMTMEDIGVVRSIPGIVIFEPVDEIQLREAMPALQAYEGCIYMRMARGQQPEVFSEDYRFDLFKADLLREGADLSIFVTGIPTKDCLDAAEELADQGISCEVINVHTIKPVDRETVLASARKTGAVLTVENHNLVGGLHAAILETLARERIPVFAVGVEDRFGEVGKLPYLKPALGLTKAHIMEAAKEAVHNKLLP